MSQLVDHQFLSNQQKLIHILRHAYTQNELKINHRLLS
jgi:hypothetical protein